MIVAYPMVEEDEATGRVAAVYAAVLEQAPFVPSLLKSLAVCPPYVVLAWEQAAPVLASADAAETVERLAASVTDAATPPGDPRDRRLLAGFVEPLGRMLLVSCGLLAALEGALAGRPSARGSAPPAPSQPLRSSVAPIGGLAAHADVLGRVRAALDTPIVNSVWRRAAEEGRLEALWDQLEPQATANRARADALHDAATA
ncbi:MAG TPA: hypothetical protein VGV36_02455, partial [Solirubrobacteraceae bacterium]|nr:hypothetical protein [Solirubrobacteraceae bacterium]